MKRLLLIIGICLLLIPCSVNADEIKQLNGDFSIRNGIRFGMTSQEILQAEGSNGTLSERDGEVRVGYHINSIAGVPIGRAASDTLIYHLDKYSSGNQLSGIDYWSGYYDNTSKAKDYYPQIYNSMTAKYGESFGEFVPFYTNSFSVNVIDCIRYSSSTTVQGFAQWIVRYDGYYVVISTAHLESNGSAQLFITYQRVETGLMEYYLKDLDHSVNVNSDDL